MFVSFFRFFIYSNLFIACCAVLMTWQVFTTLLHKTAEPYLTGFIFFSTICSYSFHWWLSFGSARASDRLDWLNRYRNVHAVGFLIGLAGSLYYFYFLADYWPWILVAVIATFLYSAPKIQHPYTRLLLKVAFGKTIFLSFVWMYVTTVLPLIISGESWNAGFTWFTISRFFLIYAICILFDYRDRKEDQLAGIRSLIIYLPEKGITILFIFSLIIFLLSAIMLLNYGFDLLTVCTLILPGILLAILYNYARQHFSDMLYYFVIDGLMALPAILMLLASI